jgi:arylsulfatase A-like enzyme
VSQDDETPTERGVQSIIALHHPEPRLAAVSHGFVTTACCAIGLALVDFVLFEWQFDYSRLNEFVFSKPRFLGFNLLTEQLAVFVAVASAAFLGLFIVHQFLPSVIRRKRVFGPSPMAIFLLSSAIIFLRFLKSGNFILKLLIMGIFAIFIIAFSIVLSQPARKSTEETPTGKIEKKICSTIIFTSLVLAFLIPDIHLIFEDQSPVDSSANIRSNIILIVLDTVRADSISQKNENSTDTPNIDQLAQTGIRFANAYAAAPWTVPSHASMFTGLPTTVHRADWGHQYLAEEFTTVAEDLQGLGYRTVGFSENPFIGRSHGFSQGFNEFFETWRSPMLSRAIEEVGVRLGIYRTDREYAGRTLGFFQRWLDQNRTAAKPIFVYLNFMAAHLPRYPRKGFDIESITQEDLDAIEPVNLVPERYYLPGYRLGPGHLYVMRVIYDQQIQYLDVKVGELFDELSSRGLLESTTLIITSDHGENFGEHGLIEHQFSLNNSLIHVPLILWNRRISEPRTVTKKFSTKDLKDLLITIADSDVNSSNSAPNYESFGNSTGDDFIVAEYANGFDMLRATIGDKSEVIQNRKFDRSIKSIILRNYKYIWYSNGVKELFDISSDYHENNNLFHTHGSLAAELEQRLFEALGDSGDDEHEDQAPMIDEATADALRALGYGD